MIDHEILLDSLEQLIKRKKSKFYYSQQLNVPIDTIDALLKELKKRNVIEGSEIEGVTDITTDHKNGDKTIVIKSNKPLSPTEIEKLAQVDNITSFVRSSWLKSHKDKTWTYSIQTYTTVKDFYNSEELDKKLKEIFEDTEIDKLSSSAKLKGITFGEVVENKKSEKALFIYVSDDHCGSILKNSLFNKEYSINTYAKRLQEITNDVLKFEGKEDFREVFIVRLGDELDGYNGKTTRYDHDLDSTSNKEQFDIYTKANKMFYDEILGVFPLSKYTIINLCNSNHSGNGFSYIANKALEFWIEVKFPSVKIIHQDKFIDSYDFGNHIINLTHGKDERYMKSPMPINLDTKTDLWLMEYNKSHILKGSYISTIKGDMHKFNINHGKSGRYVSVPSISSGSNWIEHNYGDSEPGCLMEIYTKNSKSVQSIPIWFKS